VNGFALVDIKADVVPRTVTNFTRFSFGCAGLAQEWGEEDHSELKLRVRKNAKDVVADDVEYAEQEFQTA